MDERCVVVLSGKIGSGKDAVGKILVERFGFERMAFADAVKDEVCAMHGFRRSDLDDDNKESLVSHDGEKKTLRSILVSHATKRRDADENAWARIVVDRMRASPCRNGFVITDWRFPNELALVETAFGNVRAFRIVRSDAPSLTYADVVPTAPGLAVVSNDGTLDDLRVRVLAAFAKTM